MIPLIILYYVRLHILSQGHQKKNFFSKNRERFEKFEDKIIYLCVEEFPAHMNLWERDIYQRQFILNGIKDASPLDLIIISDVDEIVRPQVINQAKKFDGVTHFSMNMYQFFLNMLERTDWKASYALQKRYIPFLDVETKGKIESLTTARYHLESYANKANVSYQVINDAGWHFTYMGGIQKLKDKLASYAHADDYWPAMMRDHERLRQVIDIGIRIWSTDELVHYVPVDEGFPFFVRENLKEFIRKGFIKDIYEAFATLQTSYMDMRKDLCFSNLSNNKKLLILGNFSAIEYFEYINAPPVDQVYLNLPEPVGSLINHMCSATQSSRSEWSYGTTLEDDANRALLGDPNGRFSFHTEFEKNPWWEVDIGQVVELSEIRIFNRILPYGLDGAIPKRADELQVFISENRSSYRCLYYHDEIEYIGGIDGKPLIINPKRSAFARYIKISLGETSILHLDKVYIYEITILLWRVILVVVVWAANFL